MMRPTPFRTRLPALLALALASAGCQSLPGGGPAVPGAAPTIPGEIASARYAHVTEAIATLDRALSGAEADLGAVPLDATLVRALPAAATPPGRAPGETLRRLAERELLDAGPYRLVRADTFSGRIEYRSARGGGHVALSVRAPSAEEAKAGSGFVLTDAFGLRSLAELAGAAGAPRPAAASPAGVALPPRAAGHALPGDDAELLAYLDALPRVEREREDLLGLRALLALRLDEPARARPLVERGIVRYPDAPLFFALAGALLERAGPAGDGPPASLARIVEHRFDRREIEDGVRLVERFLGGETSYAL